MAASLALRSRLDPGRVVRTLGDEYTGAWSDADTILHEVKWVVNLENYQYVKRMLTKGYPSKLMFGEPGKNKLKMNKRGNQKLLLIVLNW